MESSTWSRLPDHAIIKILSYLPVQDRCRAGWTCKTWLCCSRSPSLWHRMTFTLLTPDDGRQLQWLELYAKDLRFLRLVLDQQERRNREHACMIIEVLAKTEARNITSVEISFVGENPLFYAGQDLVDACKLLFASCADKNQCSLKHVDLSGMTAAFDETLIDILSEHNPELESLNVLNKMLICKVSPGSVLRLVDRCRKLTDFKLYYCSMTDKALEALAQPDRASLKHLTLMCRREQKFSLELESESWSKLTKRYPDFRVSLAFDHTCPLDKVRPIMKPDIPVSHLHLETFTYLFDEVNQAASFYANTLETLVLQTRNSPELADSLINLCSTCSKLTTLLVYCVLDKEVVEKILQLCPTMKKRGSYILKWKPEPEPWVVGVEEGE